MPDPTWKRFPDPPQEPDKREEFDRELYEDYEEDRHATKRKGE